MVTSGAYGFADIPALDDAPSQSHGEDKLGAGLHVGGRQVFLKNWINMHIAHVALWTSDLERAANFYREQFGAQVGPEYHSTRRRGFVSRFVQLESGPSIELMLLPGLEARVTDATRVGWAHIAIGLGSETAVEEMAAQMNLVGALISQPRWTGDGYFEAVITDPDGNEIEITV